MKKIGTFWQAVRDFWKTGKTGTALFLISLFALIYGKIALDFEIAQGWKGHVSVQNVVKDISAFISVGAAIVAMIIGGIDLIMLLSDFIQARREKQIEAAKEEGKAEVYRETAAWDRRRKEAEDRGEEFTEPLPTKQHEKYVILAEAKTLERLHKHQPTDDVNTFARFLLENIDSNLYSAVMDLENIHF